MTESVEPFCPSHNPCPFESNFIRTLQENHILRSEIQSISEEFSSKVEKFDREVATLNDRKNVLEHEVLKLGKRKKKIHLLRSQLKEKEQEIIILKTTIELHEKKIESLKNSRQESETIIKNLEEEIIKTKKCSKTPPHKKECFSGLLRTQTFNLQITEDKPSHFENEKERIIENHEKTLREERIASKRLKCEIELLRSENQDLKSEISLMDNELTSLTERMLQTEKKAFENQRFFIEKIDQYKIEKNDLETRLREYQDEYNISDYDVTGNLRDELSGLNFSSRSRNLDKSSQDDISLLDLKYSIDSTFQMKELKKEKNKLKFELSELQYENDKLRKEIHKKNRSSFELNKVLTQTTNAMKSFKRLFSSQNLTEEVHSLKLVKQQILLEIVEYRKELIKITEKTIQQRLKQRQTFLEDSIPESLEGSFETPERKITQKRRYKDHHKRRRNIASWGYDVLGAVYY